VNGLSDAQFKHLLAVGAFNNYAIQGLYTPGSTFKLVTATAEMQTGVLSPNVLIDDTGQFKVPGCHTNPKGCVFHDDETTGSARSTWCRHSPSHRTTTSITWAISSVPAGQVRTDADPERRHDYGLDQYTDIDLPDEVQGRVDSRSA